VRIFVTGASSFVGAHFCSLAIARGHEVVGLWRNTATRIRGLTAVQGDCASARPPDGCDAVVHLATKVMASDAREQNRRMLDGVLSWGLPVVYASSTVVHWPRKNAYALSRVEDEDRVRKHRPGWLIMRPCAPYGPRHPEHTPQHKESFHTLARMCHRLPAVPMMGDGNYRRQPVHVDDFNGAILALLGRGAWGGAFDAGGPTAMTMREIVRALGGKRVISVPLRVLRRVGPLAGLSEDVVSTFDTDDVVDPRPLADASGVAPRAFDPTCLADL
jgi:NADH dehydrogenase